MNAARVRAALHAAGVSSVDPARIEHIARGTYRMQDGSRLLACKLFDGPQAGDRAGTEAAAYGALAARDAPVPRPLAVDEANAAIVREWVDGPTLAQAMRGEADRPAWSSVASAWDALLHALDAWTEALDHERVDRARRLRQSETSAVAQAVIGSDLLQSEGSDWEAAAGEIRQLAHIINSGRVRTVPLDLNPANLVLGRDGVAFVDLEAFGLDVAEWSLCKATMLPHDPRSGKAGQALIAGEADDPRSNLNARIVASALLLALADAAGLWRSEPAHPAGLTLVRELTARAPNLRHLAAALV